MDPTPLVDWKQAGPHQDPSSILRGRVRIFGVQFVATAIAVENYPLFDHLMQRNRGHAQKGTTTLADVELTKWHRVVDTIGCYETMKINSKNYVVFMRPAFAD